MTAGMIYDFLCSIAPVETQMSFDNAGFLIGDKQRNVEKVLLSLDVTSAVVDEAIETGVQLIISHHPVIFDPIKSILTENNEKVIKLIQNSISVISMHTNLDIAEGGVNDVLLKKLELNNLGALSPDNCGRYGEYDNAIDTEQFVKLCRDRLNVSGLRYVPGKNMVKRVAVLGGAGADYLEFAVEHCCDAFVTADVKYHRFLEAAEYGLTLVDADHFCTENPVIVELKEKLEKSFTNVEFIISKVHVQTVRSL